MKKMKRVTLMACVALLSCALCMCAFAEETPAVTEIPAETVAPAETEEAVFLSEEVLLPDATPTAAATEEPVVTVAPFSEGYVLAEAGKVLYANDALTDKVGELAADTIFYVSGRTGDVFCAFYAADGDVAAGYIKADKVAVLTEAEVNQYIGQCKNNNVSSFVVGNANAYLVDVQFVTAQPVVEEPVVEPEVPVVEPEAPVAEPEVTRSIAITMAANAEKVEVGTVITVTAKLTGFEDVNYTCRWEYAPVDAEGNIGEWVATDVTAEEFELTVTEENISTVWRVGVTIAD